MFVQIADFGMSRDVTNDSYYITSGGKIPVKWTAPEVRDPCACSYSLVTSVCPSIYLYRRCFHNYTVLTYLNAVAFDLSFKNCN